MTATPEFEQVSGLALMNYHPIAHFLFVKTFPGLRDRPIFFSRQDLAILIFPRSNSSPESNRAMRNSFFNLLNANNIHLFRAGVKRRTLPNFDPVAAVRNQIITRFKNAGANDAELTVALAEYDQLSKAQPVAGPQTLVEFMSALGWTLPDPIREAEQTAARRLLRNAKLPDEDIEILSRPDVAARARDATRWLVSRVDVLRVNHRGIMITNIPNDLESITEAQTTLEMLKILSSNGLGIEPFVGALREDSNICEALTLLAGPEKSIR